MIRMAVCTIFLALTSSCSPIEIETNEIKGWEKYAERNAVQGLRVKPIEVIFKKSDITINGTEYGFETSLGIIKQSRNLSPMPDILVRAGKNDFSWAASFAKRVADEGLCDGRGCFYEIVE